APGRALATASPFRRRWSSPPRKRTASSTRCGRSSPNCARDCARLDARAKRPVLELPAQLFEHLFHVAAQRMRLGHAPGRMLAPAVEPRRARLSVHLHLAVLVDARLGHDAVVGRKSFLES